jgi:hypothetical protein
MFSDQERPDWGTLQPGAPPGDRDGQADDGRGDVSASALICSRGVRAPLRFVRPALTRTGPDTPVAGNRSRSHEHLSITSESECVRSGDITVGSSSSTSHVDRLVAWRVERKGC